PEFIGVDDYHGLIEMLEVLASGLDSKRSAEPLVARLNGIRSRHEHVLKD
ncbi:MAG: hypothetical protein GY741_15420, partial [Phycisphaeraceae bacterium]|nr:hypothetical protein [Phycisphaeraceae bacterium]